MDTALNKQCRFVEAGPLGAKKEKERNNIRAGPGCMS
jgi:hypothetical protein